MQIRLVAQLTHYLPTFACTHLLVPGYSLKKKRTWKEKNNRHYLPVMLWKEGLAIEEAILETTRNLQKACAKGSHLVTGVKTLAVRPRQM
jgi:hypothetical protein